MMINRIIIKFKIIFLVSIAISILTTITVFATSSEETVQKEEVVVDGRGANILVNNEEASDTGTYYSEIFQTSEKDMYINYDYTNNGEYPTTIELQEKAEGSDTWESVPGTSIVVQPGEEKYGRYSLINYLSSYTVAVYNENAATYPVNGIIKVVAYS